MQIKTNLKAEDSLLAIQNKLRERFPDKELNFELDSTDKVLHVHGLPEDSVHAAQVENAIKETGFDASWLTRGEEK